MHQLRARGVNVLAIDTKIGGSAHDVLGPLGTDLVRSIRAKVFHAVFLAPPCSSFSVLHPMHLRSRAQPDGIEPIPPHWQAYVRKHNALAAVSARIFQACHEEGIPVAAENPADRGEEASPAFWAEHSNHGSLWRSSSWAPALEATGATCFTFAQCAFHSPSQKWTTIAAAGGMPHALAGLGSGRFGCHHGREPHQVTLLGHDSLGRSRATMAAAYPPALDLFLANALITAAEASQQNIPIPPPLPSLSCPLPSYSLDGLAKRGPQLGPVAKAACELARSRPIGFSSPKALHPAPRGELLTEAFPGDLHAPVTSTKVLPPGKTLRRKALLSPDPVASPRPRLEGPDQGEQAQGAPPGKIPIGALFLGNVYQDEVLSWLSLVDAAAAAIRRGDTPARIPTRTIMQDKLQPWARGIVWDCADPEDCTPIVRSTRDTSFPGARQVNRAALREIAAELNWHDTDILSQIGEGGVEVRSNCEPVIILAFHHESLLQAIPMAEKTVAAHMAEEWVAPLTRHLPFVPCRLQPRGVVLQSRVRLNKDGSVEEYTKPRITSDSSFGGIDSVNAGVASHDRSVKLPSVQQLGRGWAICDTAFRRSGKHAGASSGTSGYCIDAESAYSFCCVQHADLWTQCLVWWDPSGRAGFTVDRRLGFGGAFAPNRFERISTLVAAYAQLLHAQLDREQPPPPPTMAWSNERRSLQRQGRLPPGEAQANPRYLQVYMDDFTGAAGNDPVVPPASVQEIRMDPAGMAAMGCNPAPPHSRVMTHARLTVLALQRAGLHAAPQKTMCGDPLVALGLRLDGGLRSIDCPPVKQASVLVDVAAQRALAVGSHSVVRANVRRLVGRLCNLSQIAPHLRPALHGGYSLTEASYSTAGGRRASPNLQLAPCGVRMADWLDMLDTAHAELSSNAGVAMAPRLTAPPRDGPGAATSVTDASGVDGYGGYGFINSRPLEVFLLSEPWSEEALSALWATADPGQAATRRAHPECALPSLPMPAGELFTSILLPKLLGRVEKIQTCYAVGDCDPAVNTLASLHSRHPQMRLLAGWAGSSSHTWVPAQVPREANTDADRLSHPSMYEAVVADLAQSKLRVTRLRPSADDLAVLSRTIAASLTHSRGTPLASFLLRGPPEGARRLGGSSASPRPKRPRP